MTLRAAHAVRAEVLDERALRRLSNPELDVLFRSESPGRSLVNLVGPLRMRAIRARLSRDRSWVDGEECVLIDYSATSTVARMVRDEVRLVAPGLYLGVVWVRRRRAGWFTLRQPGSAPSTAAPQDP